MNASRRIASLAVLIALCLLGLKATPLAAQAAASSTDSCTGPGQHYTMAEYNSYTAAANEKDSTAQLKALDDFVAKYPNSCLMNYIYPLYYQNYGNQKNYAKVMEYTDKEVALGAKSSDAEKLQAYSVRAFAYNHTQNPDAATSKSAYDAAVAGAKLVDTLPKPDGVAQDKFEADKKNILLNFNGTAANAALAAKDYPSAIAMYKVVLSTNPDDFVSYFNTGRAQLALTPPQQLDAIWSFARAATSKTATEQQSKAVKAYLPKVIANYQGGTVCDALSQAELNELLQLAATSPERPASYKLYSAADLAAAQKDMTIASVVTDLKAGGDKAKLTWTAACGLEFPEVPMKALEVTPGTEVVIKGAFVTSDAEFEAATTANMEFKITGQDDAGKIEKDSFVHITGTLESYDPDPSFMLHWDKAKVKDDDLPKPDKKPAKKAPAKKP
ncbi:MAG TPA: hypothetical protein VMH89_07515 [Candidatus Acidoferrum sp.]|nr:hypothetical protein [Candidatus Acidoferrum sp.]